MKTQILVQISKKLSKWFLEPDLTEQSCAGVFKYICCGADKYVDPANEFM